MMSTTSLTTPFASSSRSRPCPRNGLLVVAKQRPCENETFPVCPAMHHDKNVARNVPSRQRCDSNAGCAIERYIFARFPLQQPEAVSLEFGDWLFIRCNLDHMRFIFLASRRACDRTLISLLFASNSFWLNFSCKHTSESAIKYPETQRWRPP